MNEAASSSPLPNPRPASIRNPWLFVAVGVIGLAGWQWLDTRSRLADIQQEVAQRLAEAGDAGKDQRAALQAAMEDVANLQAKTAALEARLAEFQGQAVALQGVYQDVVRAREEGTLLEVEQAVTLAAQQLQLAGNVPTAVLALQAADAKLARLDRPQFLPLRKALAKDLDKLRALPLADVPGMSVKLEGALLAVDKLPLAMNQRPPAERPAAVEATAGQPWWRRAGDSLWQEVKGLVRIQRFDRDEPVLLAPGQAFLLRENLKLRLLNARLALLSRDQETFRSELKTAQEGLSRHFDGQDKTMQGTQATLKQLAASELNIEVPNLNDSLAALRSVRNGKGGK